MQMPHIEAEAAAIDLFCGIGGLSYGLKKSGIKLVAGVDTDEKCKYAYEKNNHDYDDSLKNLHGAGSLNKQEKHIKDEP